jgi:spore coat protein U-like protein
MKTNIRKTFLATAASFAFGISGAAMADSHTGTFDVSATVVASCHVDSTQNIDFPAFDAFTGDSGTGDLEIRCTNGSGYSIELAYSGNMSDNGNTLAYGLYQDAGHTTPWDDDASTMSDTGTGAAESHTVHANVPADATAAVGQYSETVNVTVVLD